MTSTEQALARLLQKADPLQPALDSATFLVNPKRLAAALTAAGYLLEKRDMTREEAIDKALLYVLQLSNIDYRKMQTAMTPLAFIRALEQDGYLLEKREDVERRDAVVEAAQSLRAAKGLLAQDCYLLLLDRLDALALLDQGAEDLSHFYSVGKDGGLVKNPVTDFLLRAVERPGSEHE